MLASDSAAAMQVRVRRSGRFSGCVGGCTETFSAADFTKQSRDALYYARVFETLPRGLPATTDERDAEGEFTKVTLCPGDEGDADRRQVVMTVGGPCRAH